MLVIITCNQIPEKQKKKKSNWNAMIWLVEDLLQKQKKKTLLQLSSFCASSIFRYSISKKTKKQINHMAILLIHLLNAHCIYLWIYKFVQSCICCRMIRNIYLHWGEREKINYIFFCYICCDSAVPLFVYFLSEYKQTCLHTPWYYCWVTLLFTLAFFWFIACNLVRWKSQF